jgi:DNA repair protein RadC
MSGGDSSGRIREMDEAERPREKLTHRGAASLSDAELLAIFLRTGLRGRNVIDVAKDVLAAAGGLLALSRLSVEQIRRSTKGIGPAKAVELAAVFEVGKRLARVKPGRARMDNPQAIYDLLAPELITLDREQLHVVLVDTKVQFLRNEIISMGSLNESIAHPREIIRPVVVHGAYGFILVHNHPSGDPSPSPADRALTARIEEAARLLQVVLFDHVIIGHSEGGREPYFSFREHGIL